MTSNCVLLSDNIICCLSMVLSFVYNGRHNSLSFAITLFRAAGRRHAGRRGTAGQSSGGRAQSGGRVGGQSGVGGDLVIGGCILRNIRKLKSLPVPATFRGVEQASLKHATVCYHRVVLTSVCRGETFIVVKVIFLMGHGTQPPILMNCVENHSKPQIEFQKRPIISSGFPVFM